METLRDLADQSIHRACGFAGLAAGTVLLALSFDLPLALRACGAILGLFALGLALAGWRAPRKDVRRTELWSLLAGTAGEGFRRLPRPQAQAVLSGVLRERLLWHADRVAAVALAVWLPGALIALVR